MGDLYGLPDGVQRPGKATGHYPHYYFTISKVGVMHQVYKTLPDDRPITSISIVEDPDKCPQGYFVVHRTLDQDSDADLWREASFFGRKVTRYVCLSKTEGITDYIVDSVAILNEKENPPDGYTLVMRTVDSEQKAWRKRQLCYRLSKRTLAKSVVTDIIILSRLKKAPEGFSLAGDINGMTICYKVRPSQETNGLISPSNLLYSINPQPQLEHQGPHSLSQLQTSPHHTPARSPVPSPAHKTPTNGNSTFYMPLQNSESEHGTPRKPFRPAPKPPENQPGSYATIVSYHELEGVPFILHPSFANQTIGDVLQIPVIKAKSKYELDKEYDYDFRTERQT